MARLIFDHSNEEWIDKLTVPEQQLTLSERDAIATHVAECPDCARIIDENALLKRFIQARAAPPMPPGLPPRLLKLWEEEDRLSEQEPMSLLDRFGIILPEN